MERSTGTSGSADLALTISAEAHSVALARLFAASTARLFGVDEETVDDIKIAISEAATNVVQDGRSVEISIVATRLDEGLVYAVRGVGSGREAERSESSEVDGRDADDEIGLRIIRSLFPDARVDGVAPATTTLRFCVEVPA